tara:strand:+ start:208 stop:1095 length:888 start_codon:yes stop_codon:yes gene_type:complete
MAGLMDVIAKLTEQTENKDGKGTLTEIAESMSVEKDGPVDKFNQRSFINPTESIAVAKAPADPSSLSKLASRVSNKAKDFLADPIPKSFYRTQNKQSWGNDPTIKNIIVNDPIIEKIIQTESSNDANAISPKGAVGLMQVMPETGWMPGYGVTETLVDIDEKLYEELLKEGINKKDAFEQSITRDDRKDPVKSVKFGAQYYNGLLKKFGNERDALIAYNMGPGATQRWLAEGADINQLTSETQGYIKKILGEESTMEEPMGMASLEIEDDTTVMSNQGGRVERDPYDNYNTQRNI